MCAKKEAGRVLLAEFVGENGESKRDNDDDDANEGCDAGTGVNGTEIEDVAGAVDMLSDCRFDERMMTLTMQTNLLM